MPKTLEKIVKGLVYATFVVPLVVMPSSFIFPFIVPKIILFRSLVVAMAVGYALLYLSQPKEYRFKLTPLSIALLAFMGSFALSSFVGVDFYHSFWDNHERMLGLFTILHYGIYYFICTSIFKTWRDWKWTLRIFLMAGSISMFIGLLQVGNPDLLLNQGSTRVASTLGNAIYVGGYGLFLFFMALLLFLKEKDFIWKVAAAGVGILALFGLFYSGTRGSMLGLLGAVIIVLITYAILFKEHPAIRKGIAGILVIMTIVIGFLYANRESQWVQQSHSLNRLLNISISGTGNTRLIAWKIALESWKEYPVFGWGPNNFFFAFNKHYNPLSLSFGPGETWFDNAHNILLNTLAVQGLVGLLTYIALFVVAWWAIWRAFRKGAIDKHVAIISAAFLMAHLMQNVLVFENPTSYLYFMFSLAMINSLTNSEPATEERKSIDRPVSGLVLSSLVTIGLIVIFITDIQPARANMKTLTTMMKFTANPVANVGLIEETLNFSSPHVDDIRSDLVRIGLDVVTNYHQQLGVDRSIQLLQLFERELQKNMLLHPSDIRNYMMASQVHQLAFSLTNNGAYLMNGEQELTTALSYSPRRQQLIYMLAAMKAQLGKNAEAVTLMEQSIKDNPKIGEGYWRLAYYYFFWGDKAGAQAVFKRADQNNVTITDQGQQIRSMVFATTTDKKK